MDTKIVNLYKEKYDVYIGRPSKWGNPFKNGTREENIESYRKWIMLQLDLLAQLPELEGKTLGCFCKPLACHGDILVDLVKRRFWTVLYN